MLAFQLLSPLHIGTYVEKYTPLDYLILGNDLYLINENRLFALLKEKNLISEYVSKINLFGHNFRIYKFLEENLGDINLNLIRLISHDKAKIETDKNFLEFRPLIRDGRGTPFIPGSSIKGVIRTAVLYKILKILKQREPKKFEAKIINKIKKASPEVFKQREPFKKMINQWLQEFQIENKRNTPHSDWLRLVRVRDAYPVFKSTSRIYEIVILSYDGNSWQEKENFSIFLECLPSLSIYQFELQMDTLLLEKFKIPQNLEVVKDAYPRNIASLLEVLKEFSSDLCMEEQKNFQYLSLEQWYKKISEKDTFLLGWGGGLLSKTIFLLLPEELRKFIRNNLRHNRGGALAPKTRRVIKHKREMLPLGWAKWVQDGETVLEKQNYKIVLRLKDNNFQLEKN